MQVAPGLNILTCKEWGARPPKAKASVVGDFSRIIVHHTSGHWVELDHMPTESPGEFMNYCRTIQNFHMGPSRGWNDTGQNFTIGRNGLIAEGRHGSIDAIMNGRMVVSAHCPGQNDNPGIECEHLGTEKMTHLQYDSLVAVCAWIQKCGKNPGDAIKGHRDYYPTACPANLYQILPKLRTDVTAKMKLGGAKTPHPTKNYVIVMRDKDGKVHRAVTSHPGDWLGKYGIIQHDIIHATIDKEMK